MNGPRKSLQDRIAEEEKRQEELRVAIADLKARARTLDRKFEVRRKIVAGAAVFAHAKLNRVFAETLANVFRAAVRPQDRVVLPEYFPAGNPEPAAPERPPNPPAGPASRTAPS